MKYFADINYLAVVVSAIIYYFIGFVWYSLLFSKIWAKETGILIGSQDKPKAIPMVGQFLSTLLYTLGIAVLLKLYGTYGIREGICVSALVTIFFVIPINSGTLFFKGKKKLFLLDICERAIGSVVIGIILGIWK